jgi:glutamine amidotransferase
MKTVTIIDYGMSNLRSVSKALEHVADSTWRVQVSHDPQIIRHSDKVVFPGQGAIGNCMALLRQTEAVALISEMLAEKPFLGICLGLQTLLTRSEESGGTAGFDWIAGTVRRFTEPLIAPDTGERLKIPHMGWNQVEQTQSHPLWKGIDDNSRFYFVHSYYVDPIEAQVTTGTTYYGGVAFTSALAKENIFATQFHPEKSQHAGLTLLKNFLVW